MSADYFVLLFLFNTEITVPPLSVTAPLYTLANFTCEGRGRILAWSIQDTLLTDPIKQSREISVNTTNISVGTLSSVLTIRALPINDGIAVGCNVASGSGQNYKIVSKGAVLTVG